MIILGYYYHNSHVLMYKIFLQYEYNEDFTCKLIVSVYKSLKFNLIWFWKYKVKWNKVSDVIVVGLNNFLVYYITMTTILQEEIFWSS